MIDRILRSYTFVGTIHRLDLFVGIILVSITTGLCATALGALGITEPSFYESSQLGRVSLGIVVVILIVPLLMARLRDLKWSPGWVAIYVISAIPSLRNILIFEAEFGELSYSYPLKIVSMIMLPVVIFFLGTLLLRPSRVRGAA
jgi:hypothetical protein